MDAEADLAGVDADVADFFVADAFAVQVDPEGVAVDDAGDGGEGDVDVEMVAVDEWEVSPAAVGPANTDGGGGTEGDACAREPGGGVGRDGRVVGEAWVWAGRFDAACCQDA